MDSCAACGAKMVEYTFSFNIGLLRCLRLMRNHTEGVEIRTLGLSTSQWTNFQKLRYWGLIAPVSVANLRKGGCWRITQFGTCFLEGTVKIPKRVTTYRNKVVLKFDNDISVNEVKDGYEYQSNYQAQAAQ